MRVGFAFGGYTSALLSSRGHLFDFVEVPFELLQHDPSVLKLLDTKPVILHCASLSIAGSTRPAQDVVASIRRWIRRTKTPWLGEHLAFITADKLEAGANADEYAPGQPYNLGFTVSPPMNSASVNSIVKTARMYEEQLGIPILLENSPIYFTVPGTEMAQTDFVQEICRRSNTRLLLDLTHFLITARNLAFDPSAHIQKLPLDRVDEIHISGSSFQENRSWDDHAAPASDEVFDLLRAVVRCASPKAITLEYNWSATFPEDWIIRDLDRINKVIRAAA